MRIYGKGLGFQFSGSRLGVRVHDGGFRSGREWPSG